MLFHDLFIILSCRKCDVLNRGFSGYNSAWCRIILPHIVDASMVSEMVAMVIFLGANDSNLREGNPHQHVPLEDYRKNLLHMIDYLHVCNNNNNNNTFLK